MAQNSKLGVLIKSARAQEHQVAKELVSLREVFDRREAELGSVQQELEQLQKELKKALGRGVDSALAAGDGKGASQQGLLVVRLEQSIACKEKELEPLRAAVERAKQRVALCEEELLEARVELKRVERLQEQRESESRRSRSAREEAEADELAMRKKPK